MSALKVVALQVDLAWEAAAENRAYFEQQFEEIAVQNPDLLVLPEMFTTGFSKQPQKLAETMEGTTISWMQSCAKKHHFLLTGSLIIKENANYYNRQVFAFPDGGLQYYDKRHLFRMGEEHKHYTAGNKRIVINYKGWRILPQICYDLRFPVWARNRNDYDLLLYIANFPASRRQVWNTLLLARAIENQCYVVGCNRIGIDGEGLHYTGDSQILSPKGEILVQAETGKPCAPSYSLSLDELQAFRKKFPVHLDADDFQVEV